MRGCHRYISSYISGVVSFLRLLVILVQHFQGLLLALCSVVLISLRGRGARFLGTFVYLGHFVLHSWSHEGNALSGRMFQPRSSRASPTGSPRQRHANVKIRVAQTRHQPPCSRRCKHSNVDLVRTRFKYIASPYVITRLDDDLLELRAPNASPMTGDGTNTYIVGHEELAVIDPGPDDPGHFSRIMGCLTAGHRLKAILITHSHLDHSPLARRLSAATGAEICAFGDSLAGRSELMHRLAQSGLSGGGEGVDTAFKPDRILENGATFLLDGEPIRAIWTPGHFGNHMCFRWRDVIFSGDHVMGWATSIVSPPDGDISAYMASLDRLQAERARRLYPGHGAPVDDPQQRISHLRNHRQGREIEILSALRQSPLTIMQLVARIYVDIPVELHPAAGRNVFAHLIDLHCRNRVRASPDLTSSALFSLIGTE